MAQPARTPSRIGRKIERLDEAPPSANSKKVSAPPDTTVIAKVIKKFLTVLFTASSLQTLELLQEGGSA
jgi:hypothetical protein